MTLYLTRLSLWLFITLILLLALMRQIGTVWQSAVFAYTVNVSSHSLETEIRAIDSRTGASALLLRADSVVSFSVSPDSQWLVYDQRGAGISNIRRLQLFTGQDESLLWGNFSEPQWSPDGQWIAYASIEQRGRGIWIIPSSGGIPRQVVTVQRNFTWSADSQEIWFTDITPDRAGNEVRARAIATGRMRLILVNQMRPTTLAMSSTQHLAFMNVLQLFVYDLRTQTFRQVTYDATYRPIWQGEELAFINQGQIVVMDASGEVTYRLRPPHLSSSGSIAWLTLRQAP